MDNPVLMGGSAEEELDLSSCTDNTVNYAHSNYPQIIIITCLRVTATSFIIRTHLDNCEAIQICANHLISFLIYPQMSLQHVKKLKLLLFRIEKSCLHI